MRHTVTTCERYLCSACALYLAAEFALLAWYW